MRTVCVLPVRGGSTRIPQKYKTPVGDYPLVVHELHVALNSKVTKVVLAYDDPEVRELVSLDSDCMCAVLSGNLVLIQTPTSCPTPIDRAAKALEEVDDWDAAVLMHCELPYCDARDIDNLAAALYDEQAVTLAEVVDDPPPASIKLAESEGRVYYGSRARFRGAERGKGAYLCRAGMLALRRPVLEAFAATPRPPLETLPSLDWLRLITMGVTLRLILTTDGRGFGLNDASDLEKYRAADPL